ASSTTAAPAAFALRARRTIAVLRRSCADCRRPALIFILWGRAALLRTAAALTLPWRARGTLLLLFPRPALRAFAARPKRRQGDAAPRFVDLDDPPLQHVAHADDFVRVLDEAVGQAADVHQAAVGEADIDEHAEIDDVQHRARQLHRRQQVFQLHDPA